MTKIHGSAYILIGVFVSLMSWRLNQEKLMFFYYAGFVFVLVGALKLIFGWIKSKANATKHPQAIQQKPLHSPAHQSSIKYCHNCGTALGLHHKFCAKCGARV